MFRKIRNFFIKPKLYREPDSLVFLREYTYSDGYGTSTGFSYEPLDVIVNRFKSNVNNEYGVLITSVFNNINYAVYDLDTIEHFDLFRKLYSDTPYVLFVSSPDHYWGIPDIPYDNKNDIYNDHNWKVCNDQNYINHTRKYNSIRLRGLYEDESRKPKVYETNGILSENFKLFIDKVTTFYSKEGLELSVLRYKDPHLLMLFNRKKKLEEINKCNEEEQL